MGIFRQFPYSNFHDINMDEIIKICKELQDAWAATSAEWASYKDFIDNYFATLDVSSEVLQAIRTLATTGELNRVIDPVIADETAQWLTEHITPTTPPVDDSLTVAGAAADAKATGIATTNNAIDLALLLEHIEPDTVQNDKYYTMSGGIVSSYNVNGSTTNIYDVTSLRNKTVYISAVRNPAPYTAYVIVTGENNNYLAGIVDASNTSISNRAFTIPAEAKYLYLNYHTDDKIGKLTIDNNVKNIISKFAKAFLWSASPIYWNWQSGKIQSKTAISILIPSENYSAVLANPVNNLAEVSCGTSRFLYYDKSNATLISNGTIITNSATMLLIGACQAHELDYLTLQKGCTKKCACFGDSITWYDGQEYNWGKFAGETAIGFQTWLKRVFGFAIYNYGTSGTTSIQICERVRNANLSSMNYMTLSAGANDERHNTPLGVVLEAGSNFDVNTFCGAFQSAIESALSDNPELKIVLCTPIQGWIYSSGYDETDYPTHPDSGDIDPKWSNAIKRIAEIYALPVCDWYGESGINLCTRNEYINDPEPPENTLYSLHPTAKGYERMSEILIATLNKIMTI